MSLSQDPTPKLRIPVIVGPTGVGKTEVAVEVAQAIDAEIISADSRQIYKYMNIGTAKPSAEQQESVHHWMIDIVEPNIEYSAAKYSKEAASIIKDILAKGKRVLVTGGSGLYIRALFENFFPAPPADHNLRNKLLQEAHSLGSGALHRRLARIDPETAIRIHPNDLKRLVRALEIYELTGSPISKLQTGHSSSNEFLPLYIGLNRRKKEMKSRIEERVDRMIKRGLVEEVSGILEMGYSPDLNSLNTVGYKEIIGYLSNKSPLDESVVLIKKNTRAYAKRQLTWFRKIPDVKWIDISADTTATRQVTEHICDFLGCC